MRAKSEDMNKGTAGCTVGLYTQRRGVAQAKKPASMLHGQAFHMIHMRHVHWSTVVPVTL